MSKCVNAFYDFRMNKPADGGTKGVAYLLKKATIAGTMTLDQGLFDINVFSIDMDGRPIVGGSRESYVRTSDVGFLIRGNGSGYSNVESGYVKYPVGRTNFNPCWMINTGTSDKFSVRVFDIVTDDSYENSTRTSLPAVDRTWMIEEEVVGGSNVEMRLYWNGTLSSRDEEINAFDYNTAYIAHFNFSTPSWENKGGSAPSGPGYALQTGITSFSPFTISSQGGLGWTGPLPVELIGFNGDCDEMSNAVFNWSTASENHSSYFDLETSYDGISWRTVGSVPAAGNSTSLLNYSFLDENYAGGFAFYRLKQFDIDGKFHVYNPIILDCIESNGVSIMTFPNPSNSNFSLVFNSEKDLGETVVKLVSTEGHLVEAKVQNIVSGANLIDFNTNELKNGIYYIEITNSIFGKKVIKQMVSY